MSSQNVNISSLPDYEVKEHRLTKQVRRLVSERGCVIEYRKHLYMDTLVIQEDIILSCPVDLFRKR